MNYDKKLDLKTPMSLSIFPDWAKKMGKTVICNYYSYITKTKTEPLKILFILSHMRSGSSLLVHLLNTNPEILGYGEAGITYHSEEDLKFLVGKVSWRFRKYKISEKYILDKLLHNKLLSDNSLLNNENIFCIFLLREPTSSLASLVKLFPYRKEKQLIRYYEKRLSKLEEYAQTFQSQNRGFLLTYDQLLNHTDSVFKSLQEFLEIQTVFTENYQLLPWTGMRRIGDPSSHIFTGQILRKKEENVIKIEPEILQKSQETFNRCYAVCSRYLQSID